jgi:AIG2-like family
MISYDVLALLREHAVITSFAALVLVSLLAQPQRVYFGYGIALLLDAAASLQFGNSIKALGAGPALVYHIANGLISTFALWVLKVSTSVPMTNPFDQMKAVLMAGLGSMLFMRSKLFEAKIKDENVSFGPEQVVKVFFNYMEKAIDRVRSHYRIDFVTTNMKNIDCGKVIPYVATMLDAPQALDKSSKDELKGKMDRISQEAPTDPQYKSYRLGFLLLNEMGEDFVNRVFKDPRTEWLIAAQKASESDGLLSKLPFVGSKDYVYYFAYGKSMSLDELVKRLNWNAADVKELLTEKPRPCTVTNYRLEFSGPCGGESAPTQGCANLVPADGQKVWGVLLRVPVGVLEFLDAAQRGYRQTPVKCEVDGKPVDAICFLADPPVPGLLPSKEYVDTMIVAAKAQGLDANYIDSLQKVQTLSPASVPAGS